jgi:hypothetical protein
VDQWSVASYLSNQGIIVGIDEEHGIAHNKVIVIDRQTVFTGSFNFTKAAEESNAENLLVVSHPETVSQYRANWEIHWGHSKQYKFAGVADNTDPISPEEAAMRDGQRCAVEMTVVHVGINPNNPNQLFLNSRSYYKDVRNFTFVVSRNATPNNFDGWAKFKRYLQGLEGKTIRVIGTVSRYDGRPEIMVENPDQFLLLPGES